MRRWRLETLRLGRENRIGRRLIVLVLAFSSVVALCFTAVQLALEYRDLRRGLDRSLESVGIYVRTLEASVWDVDERQVQRVIDALVLVPDVAWVRVTDATTGQAWTAGRNPAGAVLTRSWPLRHHRHEGEFGRVDVVATLDGIRRQVIATAVGTLVNNALRTALVAIFMVFLIRRVVTARLERMAAKVRRLAPGLVLPPAAPAHPVPPDLDELDAVEWALARASEDVGAAVRALRDSEVRYRRIVETAHEGVWTVDGGGRITFANRQLAEMLGRRLDDLVGVPLLDLVHVDARADARALLEVRDGGAAEPRVVRFRREDGSDLWALVGATPLLSEGGALAGALGMVADVTGQRRLEDQLRQSQKLEAVGRLAAGVAHDFNNILTAVLGDAELLAEELPAGDPRRDGALEIHAAAQRAALLTRQLLAFGRRQTAQPRVLDLNEVVATTERMLRRLIGEDVALATVRAPGLWPVRADPGQLEQVIVNLAVNARDAMPGGGRLVIATWNADPAQARPGEPGADGRAGVVLSVSDTGAGMSAEVQAHLFEPFFTTKPPGKGTGLGLSTVYGIVKQGGGGDVHVVSAPGEGSTFRVWLPRADGAPAAAEEDRRAATSPRGDETVLVVDDEPLMRSATARMLRSAGYTVVSAADADEALVQLRSADVRLLLTDVVLPRSDGPTVAARARAACPGLPVLFVSGYTDRAVDLAPYGGAAAFLAKPFPLAALLAQVRALLDRAGRSAAEEAPTGSG